MHGFYSNLFYRWASYTARFKILGVKNLTSAWTALFINTYMSWSSGGWSLFWSFGINHGILVVSFYLFLCIKLYSFSCRNVNPETEFSKGPVQRSRCWWKHLHPVSLKSLKWTLPLRKQDGSPLWGIEENGLIQECCDNKQPRQGSFNMDFMKWRHRFLTQHKWTVDFLKTFCITKTSTFLTFGEERWHINTDVSLYAWKFLQFDLY